MSINTIAFLVTKKCNANCDILLSNKKSEKILVGYL